jgi:hypothetical protein
MTYPEYSPSVTLFPCKLQNAAPAIPVSATLPRECAVNVNVLWMVLRCFFSLALLPSPAPGALARLSDANRAARHVTGLDPVNGMRGRIAQDRCYESDTASRSYLREGIIL